MNKQLNMCHMLNGVSLKTVALQWAPTWNVGALLYVQQCTHLHSNTNVLLVLNKYCIYCIYAKGQPNSTELQRWI